MHDDAKFTPVSSPKTQQFPAQRYTPK